MLDKHKLTLQLSKRTSNNTNSSSKKGKDGAESKSSSRGTKLVVRNVAFEATRKDIMGLFGPFGHIKSCRWVGVICGCVGVCLRIALCRVVVL